MSSATQLALRYQQLRARTVALVEPLSCEDQMVQAFVYASPSKWHLAHTTWFFDTFVAQRFELGPQARVGGRDWSLLFNSYYESLGDPHPQGRRGLLSRPSLQEVMAYRRQIDAMILEALHKVGEEPVPSQIQAMLLMGINHEEQHQELILTDLLANFSLHPEGPALFAGHDDTGQGHVEKGWLDYERATVPIGAQEGFCFDHELPRHDCIVHPFALAKTLVSNAEMQAFIDDKGYERPELWLSEGIRWVREHKVQHPRYWRKREGQWFQWTLYGERALEPRAPVVHLSGYEADALATYLGARLPTEFEWEHAASKGPGPAQARWLGEGLVMPRAGQSSLFGEAWVWTRSAFLPYPGFRARAGAVGEYNGKFMSDRWVLRGGSCASPPGHLRASYRNFFHPAQNWQFSGLRLAQDRD